MKNEKPTIELSLVEYNEDHEGLYLTEKGEDLWVKAFPQITDLGFINYSDPNPDDAGFPDCLSDLGAKADELRQKAEELTLAAERLDQVDAQFAAEMTIATNWMKNTHPELV